MKVDLQLTPTSKGSKVLIDGVDHAMGVKAVTVYARVGEVTNVLVEYVCARDDTMVVDGDAEVLHVCPTDGPLRLAVDRDDESSARWLPYADTFVDRGGVVRARDESSDV